MDQNICFVFEGVRYTVSSRACDVPYIVLPDGRLLEAESWSESTQPQGLRVENHPFKRMKPAVIAYTMNGVVAEEIRMSDHNEISALCRTLVAARFGIKEDEIDTLPWNKVIYNFAKEVGQYNYTESTLKDKFWDYATRMIPA